MHCLCKQGMTADLQVEGDVAADPIWCSKCGCNLDLEDFKLSIELEKELMKWASNYGSWIDWNRDVLKENGIELEEEHNRKGSNLTIRVKKELGEKYRVTFSPSTIGKSYKKA